MAGSQYRYLLRSYVGMLLFALRRTRATLEDFFIWLFMLSAPLLYIFRFKGILKTPIGRFVILDGKFLRSVTYGLFKTRFAYLHKLRTFYPKNSFLRVVVDVGANLGDFTLGIRNVAEKVVAIEPQKDNFLVLQANMLVNGVNNVVCLKQAAHFKEEDLVIQGEGSNAYVSAPRSGVIKGQKVKGISLAYTISKLGITDIDILKIDVQGHEMAVILGAGYLLRGKFVKLLILEVHLKRGVSIQDIVSLMKTYKYSLVCKDNYLFDQPHLYFAPSPL
jgi:FkbM family methyltransferase